MLAKASSNLTSRILGRKNVQVCDNEWQPNVARSQWQELQPCGAMGQSVTDNSVNTEAGQSTALGAVTKLRLAMTNTAY